MATFRWVYLLKLLYYKTFSSTQNSDLLIDKQEIIRNKVLKTNGLCRSDTMDVSVRRQFKGKIFGFRINSGTFVGIYHSLHLAKRQPWTASPSPSPSPAQTLPDLLVRACFVIWGLDLFRASDVVLILYPPSVFCLPSSVPYRLAPSINNSASLVLRSFSEGGSLVEGQYAIRNTNFESRRFFRISLEI